MVSRGAVWAMFLLTTAASAGTAALLVLNADTPQPQVFVFRGSGIVFPILLGGAGLLVAMRQPGNATALIFGFCGLVAGGLALAEEYAIYSLFTSLEGLLGESWAASIRAWAWVPLVGLTTGIIPLLFPSGSLPPSGWRLAAALNALVILAVTVGFMTGPFLVKGLEVPNRLAFDSLSTFWETAETPALGLLVAAAAVAAYALFRQGRLVKDARQQLAMWPLVALILAAVGIPFWIIDNTIGEIVAFAGFVGIPIAGGMAILKS